MEDSSEGVLHRERITLENRGRMHINPCIALLVDWCLTHEDAAAQKEPLSRGTTVKLETSIEATA